VYVLPTRLHHKYYEHILSRKAGFPEKYSSLEALVCDAITHFSRRALLGVEPKLGPGLYIGHSRLRFRTNCTEVSTRPWAVFLRLAGGVEEGREDVLTLW